MNPFVLILEWIKTGLLAMTLNITAVVNPYESFDRPAELISQMTLEQKASVFDIDILQNHLTSEDIFLYELPHNLGDQCIWNGVHVAYRAIRYGATKDESDLILLTRFVKSLKLMQTHPETGETILIRGRVPLAEFNGSRDPNARHLHENDKYIWQEDASGDSFVGQVYALAMAHKYGDEEVRRIVSTLAVDLYVYVQRNKFHLRNHDGSKTKFSKIGPGISASPARVVGLLLLAKLVEIQTCDLRVNSILIKDDYENLAITKNQIHVAANAYVIGLWIMKYANSNLVTMATHGLVELEKNPKRRKKYIKTWRRGWRVFKKDGNAYLTFLLKNFHPKSIKDKHLEVAVQVLAEFEPGDYKVGYGIDLREDKDIRHTTWGRGSKKKKAVQPYPVWRQPAKDYYWQRDPHDLHDHGTCTVNCKKFSGLDYLVAYYTGKLYDILE